MHAVTNQRPPSSGSSSTTMTSKINNVFFNEDESKQLTELLPVSECLCNTSSGRYHRREHREAELSSITIAMVASLVSAVCFLSYGHAGAF